jgi:hypothetical protein
VICQDWCTGPRGGEDSLAEGQDALRGRDVLVAALKSRYFRHRCYRCFLHSVSSVTINEVTDQSGADVVAVASLLGAHGCVTAAISFVRDWNNAAYGLLYLMLSPSKRLIIKESIET